MADSNWPGWANSLSKSGYLNDINNQQSGNPGMDSLFNTVMNMNSQANQAYQEPKASKPLVPQKKNTNPIMPKAQPEDDSDFNPFWNLPFSQGFKKATPANVAEGMDNLESVQNQKDALDQMNQGLDWQNQMPVQPSLRGLMAFTDSMTGSDFSKNYQPPPSPQDREAMKQKILGAVNQGNQELTKDQLSAIQMAQGAQNKEAQTEALIQRLNATLGARNDQNGVRFGTTAAKDPILVSSDRSINSLDRAYGQLTGKAPVTASNLDTAWADYVNALNMANVATEGAISRDLPDFLVKRKNRVQAELGNIQDLRNDETGKAFVDLLLQQIAQVKADVQEAKARKGEEYYGISQNSSNQSVRTQGQTIKNRTQVQNQPQNSAPPQTKNIGGFDYVRDNENGGWRLKK